MEGAITFSKPQYIKIKNQVTGAQEPLYRFLIQNAEPLSETANKSEYPTLQAQLTHIIHDNNSTLQTLIQEFLHVNSTYFAKQYTIDMFLRNLSHAIHEPTDSNIESTESDTLLYTYTPTYFSIHNGKIQLNWKLQYETVRISIPVLEDDTDQVTTATANATATATVVPTTDLFSPLTSSHATAIIDTTNQIIDATEINSLDDIAIAESIAPEYTLQNSSRQYEKRRVKEARLRARLAQYKAERAISRYLEKYGTEATDSEWSDDSSSGSESDSD